jgi:hypothetical protein
MNNNERSEKEKEDENRRKMIVLEKQNKILSVSIGYMMVQSKISHLNCSTVLGTSNGLFYLFSYLLYSFDFGICFFFFWTVHACTQQIFASNVGLKVMFRYAIVFCLSLLSHEWRNSTKRNKTEERRAAYVI